MPNNAFSAFWFLLMNSISLLANLFLANASTWNLNSTEIFYSLTLIIFFVLLNGFFVAAEFAIVKVRSTQLDALVVEGNRRAKRARKALSKLDDYLSATQLGITIASIGLGMVGEPMVSKIATPLLHDWFNITDPSSVHQVSYIISFALVTFLHVVIGELTPKTIAITLPVQVTLAIIIPLEFFYKIFKPFIFILNGSANWLLRSVLRMEKISEHELAHSEEELRHILGESQKSKEVTETEKDILLNALALNDRCVRDVMTPRNQVISLDVNASFAENVKIAIEHKHTRFPLIDGHLDTSLGLIHIKDMLALMHSNEQNLRSIKRELHLVPEIMPIDRLLRFFLDKHVHFAIAVDEYGGTVGIVTLDNVVEEIVGDIQDEFDQETAAFKRINANEFTVEGTLNLFDFTELSGIKLESDEVSTIGGFMTHLLGRLPKTGETINWEDYQITATKTDPRRIHQIYFKRIVNQNAESAVTPPEIATPTV
jgi:CBS domain containing-hemolysin-like protein